MIAIPKSSLPAGATRVICNGFTQAPKQLVKPNTKPKLKIAPTSSKSPSLNSLLCNQVWLSGVARPGVTPLNSLAQQVRFAHTDVNMEYGTDFSEIRRGSTSNPKASSSDSFSQRQLFSYACGAGALVTAAYGGKYMVQDIVLSLWQSKAVAAQSKLEVDIKNIPEGTTLDVKWRSLPVYIRHRSQDEVEKEMSVNLSDLRDPQHDEDRRVRPDWLVVMAVCTHLGCVPLPEQGDFGGFYCPCHGSHYDNSGRIRKGPAPLNLEVPFHSFQGDDMLVIGD